LIVCYRSFFTLPCRLLKKIPVSSRFIIPGSNILFTAQLLFSFFTAAQKKPEGTTCYLLLTICGEKQFQKKKKRGSHFSEKVKV
jgi:hypothetical protein